jgi:hypothetical protein
MPQNNLINSALKHNQNLDWTNDTQCLYWHDEYYSLQQQVTGYEPVDSPLLANVQKALNAVNKAIGQLDIQDYQRTVRAATRLPGVDYDTPAKSIQIRVPASERQLVECLESAVADRCPEIFARNGALVDVISTAAYVPTAAQDRKYYTPAPRTIRPVPLKILKFYGSERIDFVKIDDETGDMKRQPKASNDVYSALYQLGHWPHIRELRGVSSTPCLRPDGTIQTPGYDTQTKTLCIPTDDYRVPSKPTQADAYAALQVLREPFVEFEFDSAAHKDVAVAGILTLLARPAIDGPVPALIIDASTPGSGKTLIADVIARIVTGVDMAKCTFPSNDDELEKILGGLALEGCQIAGFDNVADVVRGKSLDKVLTTTRPKLRILGSSITPTVDWQAMVVLTGNNVAVAGDTVRRCLRCLLTPNDENPENRSIKRHNLKGWISEHRTSLVTAALTILRAYHAAGAPKQTTKRWGSYEAWQMVADALLWAGGEDIITCRTNVSEGGDLAIDSAKNLLTLLYKFSSMTSKEIIDRAYGPEGAKDFSSGHSEMREALDGLVTRAPNSRPTIRAVGNALSRLKKRKFGGMTLTCNSASNTSGTMGKKWSVTGENKASSKPTLSVVPDYLDEEAKEAF